MAKFNTSFSDISQGLFGDDGEQSGNVDSLGKLISDSTASLSGENRKSLEISDVAINKIVADILSGPDGLAAIFGGEQNAGIFNSSVSAQAAGDLTANIVGEIAKLRAVEVETQEQTETKSEVQTEEKSVKSKEKKESEGLFDKLNPF
jgi:hypothetical protein